MDLRLRLRVRGRTRTSTAFGGIVRWDPGPALARRRSWSYPSDMKGITIKLPETTLQRLKEESRITGHSIAELVRQRLEMAPAAERQSVYALTADLAGSLAGSRRPASNERRRFRRS